MLRPSQSIVPLAVVCGVMALASTQSSLLAAGEHVTSVFSGAKVNAGTVTHEKVKGNHLLTLSDDFVVPDTPAPHWQVVDSHGNVYLLNRLQIKGDKLNKTITLPGYIRDVAKVQIWCAWAETLLGEASFPMVVK